MVADLVRRYVPGSWVERLDFTTLERVNASYVSEDLKSREGDVVWRLRLLGGEPAYIFLLVEFQSVPQRFMAVRLMVYLGLLYQQLLRQGELTADGRLPLVLPIVLYNGEERWSAPLELAELIRGIDEESGIFIPRLRYHLIDEGAFRPQELKGGGNLASLLFRLERSGSRREMRRIAGELVRLLRGPDLRGLRRAFLVWFNRVFLAGRAEERIPEIVELEYFRDMLEKSVERWGREIEEKALRKGVMAGRKEGLKEGSAEMLLSVLEARFGSLDDQVRKKVRAARPERLRQWGRRSATALRLDDVFAE
jgi:hypothetical protein